MRPLEQLVPGANGSAFQVLLSPERAPCIMVQALGMLDTPAAMLSPEQGLIFKIRARRCSTAQKMHVFSCSYFGTCCQMT